MEDSMTVASPGSPPEQGQLVNVRQRQHVVTEVAKSTLPASPLCVITYAVIGTGVRDGICPVSQGAVNKVHELAELLHRPHKPAGT
jgi:hypothetical protein